MRTFVTILSALSFALMIAACRNEGKKPEQASAPPSAEAVTTPGPAASAPPSAEAVTTPGPAASASPTAKAEPTPGPATPTEKPKPVKYDFKKADWGMTMAQVKASEPKKPAAETPNSLTYKSAIARMFAYTTYQFKDGKLYRAGFIFAEKRDTDNKFIEDYETLKGYLIQANGSPVIDEEKQINPNAVIDPDNKGAAACRGDIIYGAQWNIPRSVIRLVLRGEDSKCLLTVVYTSASAAKAVTDQDGTGKTQ